MEYVYAAMLLHKAGKPIDEDNITNVLQSVGITAEPYRVKALVAALSEVNIEDAIESASTLTPSVAAPSAEPVASETEEKPAEVEEKKEEEALEGLGALFG